MTSPTQQKKRLSDLERTNASQEGQIDLWRTYHEPPREGETESRMISAYGSGWSARRLEQEAEKAFESRCVLIAKEAGHDISFDD